ncbi:MAG TPA: LytTR family DNA-binding domain-containing protein [Chitinophagaceae bacterium]|nr:LytTR family DNA-binding domain-containing protein [Chitinophagaceae bacterium]
MMKCLIVDDEEMAVKVIENHISRIGHLQVAGVYYNAMDAFSAMQNNDIDLLFLDIQMPKMTGLSMLQMLPKQPHVIVTTAHREFALEGFNLDVVDYLLKPVSFDRFLKAIGKVYRLEKTIPSSAGLQASEPPTDEPPFFYIKSDRKFIKVLVDEVIYIESLRNHIKVVTSNGNFITLLSISQMEEKLSPQHFIRIHRSFIVPVARIKQFSQTQVTVMDHELPIGSLYRSQVLKRLGGHLF